MTNLEISTIFSSMAEIYKFKSEDKDIVVKLMRAARTINGYPEEIESIYSNERLKELPGINETSYQLIKEYFETGKIGIYEEMKAEYCEELIKFVRISGLGTRRMYKIYSALGVSNLGDLESKLSNKNFVNNILSKDDINKDIVSEFYIKKLEEAILYYKSIKGKLPRGYIENFKVRIRGELKKIKEIKKIKFVGSVRRKKSTVRDIDILILPYFNISSYSLGESEKLIKKLKTLSFVGELVSKDVRAENISARFKTVFNIDIEFIISSYKNWAVDLLYASGSKEHVRKLELIAREKGYFEDGRINISSNYNISSNIKKNLKKDLKKELEAESEEDIDIQDKEVYDMLNLQYIPPELREDSGEIELARKFLLPQLVKVEDIKGDMHIHSSWSDGIISVDEMIERVRKYKYEYIAISDHSQSNVYGRGLNEERVMEKMKYIDNLNSRTREAIILMGAEVDIRRVGKLDYSNNILKKIDIVIGALHSSFLNSSSENTARAVSALENKYVDIFAHPTGVVFGNRAPYFIDIDMLIEAASKNKKALEINSYFTRLDLNEESARKAKKKGVKIAINTDSHRIYDMDMIKLGVDVARRAGLEKDDVLNTMSWKEIREWKKMRL